MNKCHALLNFANGTEPALNDVNLNYLDGCVDTIDDRVVALANDPPANALKAEGYANGTQNGAAVPSTSPYYHNNAKYWKEQAEGVANNTLNGLTDVGIVNPQDGQVLAYNATLDEWVNDNSAVDISGKADKVSGAVNGHVAGLDSNGNLADGGVAVSDLAQMASGILTTKVIANATASAVLSDRQIRNIYAGTTDLTPGVSALATGDIYLVYE